MQERIFEIIIYVISQVKFNDQMINDINYQDLEDLGYSASEISTALSWIIDSGELTNEVVLSESNLPQLDSFRILSEFEKDYFTEEAWGELQVLLSLGLIQPVHIEYIIERAAMFNFKNIGKDLLKGIISAVLFNRMLEPNAGNKIFLSGSELIN